MVSTDASVAASSGTGHQEGSVRRSGPGASGPDLYFYAAVPRTPARATVGLIHGYGEHAARYAHVADLWAERGIATVSIDLRGHGRALGRRGYCQHFEEYLTDVAELTKLVRDRAQGGPAFLFGHSFGGLTATLSALETPEPWRALVLSSPFLAVALKVPAYKRLAGRITSRVWPTFSLPSGILASDLTHDPARINTYDADPLNFSNATARWFSEAQKTQARVVARAASLTMPLYIAMGTADKVADFATVRTFFAHAGSRDKTMDVREGLYHEVLNELEWRDIADKMAAWMLAHV
jgi:alpha-beta hydrolase superfamily lysophospholipase